MQRESSVSDWEMVDPASSAEHCKPLTRNPQSSFNEDDFFSSEKFHRIESSDFASSPDAISHHQREPPPHLSQKQKLSSGATVTEDATQPRAAEDMTNPQMPVKNSSVDQGFDADNDDPATPTSHPSNPPGARPTLQFMAGIPSSASVDSIFNAGPFSHFSPQKYSATKGGRGSGMKHSYSSSSAATPTSPPPQAYPKGGIPSQTSSPEQQRDASSAMAAAPFPAAPPVAPCGSVAEQQAAQSPPAGAAAAAAVRRGCSSFRPPLVPKLQMLTMTTCSTTTAPSPDPTGADDVATTTTGLSMLDEGTTGQQILHILTPRLPSYLTTNPNRSSSSQQCVDLSVFTWRNPIESLVKCTLAMLVINALHVFSSKGTTWMALGGKTAILVMLLGRLAIFVYGKDKLITSVTLRQRLESMCAQRRDVWASRLAEPSSRLCRYLVSEPDWSPHVSHSQMVDVLGSLVIPLAICCRCIIMFVCVEIALLHSPWKAERFLDITTFWVSWLSLRVPFHLSLSYAAATLRIGERLDASTTTSGKIFGMLLFEEFEATPTMDKIHGVDDVRASTSAVVCWILLQGTFAACAAFE